MVAVFKSKAARRAKLSKRVAAVTELVRYCSDRFEAKVRAAAEAARVL